MKIAIIGGGIIGFSLGIKAHDYFPGAKIMIFEKESQPGIHASSRNSGVLHSGVYYSGDSLKSKFSREGNAELRAFIKTQEIPLLETGKIIVAKTQDDLIGLHNLAVRGASNGVGVEMLPSKEISRYQAGAWSLDKFLYVSSTAVSDPTKVMQALVEEFHKRGGKLTSNLEITSSLLRGDSVNNDSFDWIINAAGSGALEIAKAQGVGLDYEVMPFLGIYWGSKQLGASLRIPIYPVPHPVNPFLGVHLTPTAKGLGKIGPTAIPVLGKEQYRLSNIPRLDEVFATTRGAASMIKGEKHSLSKMISTELRYLWRRNMVSDAELMFPAAKEVNDWTLVPGGIRAQLINRLNGSLLDDFKVETRGNVTHILNAVSPGWTSALSFADWIIQQQYYGGKNE